VVAFEAAQQLMAGGFDVKGLVLIDSPSPINHEPLPAEVIASITKPRGQPRSSANDAALEAEFLSNASLLGIYKPKYLSKENGKALKTVMLRSRDVFDTESLCGVRYDWLNRQDTREDAIAAWEELVGGHVEVLPIPGNHFEPFSKENVGKNISPPCSLDTD
jgi:thioesterase domain-containing protein